MRLHKESSGPGNLSPLLPLLLLWSALEQAGGSPSEEALEEVADYSTLMSNQRSRLYFPNGKHLRRSLVNVLQGSTGLDLDAERLLTSAVMNTRRLSVATSLSLTALIVDVTVWWWAGSLSRAVRSLRKDS